jgi:carbon-monoxide dehydrogenase catalytic subunit
MAAEEAKDKATKKAKGVKPEEVTVDTASIKMMKKAQDEGIETIFDRAQTMKPCNIGIEGICCKNCSQGPCRLPMTKKMKEGLEEDNRKGLCGATPETVAARNFARMVAAGAAAHSDHGRGVAEVFLAAARQETDDYKIKDTEKALQIAPDFEVATTEVWRKTARKVPRSVIYEIAVEVGEKALGQWGQQEGEIYYAKRAPEARYKTVAGPGRGAPGHRPRNRGNHAPHPHGCGPGLPNMVKQCSRAALADGWAGSMIATDLQDVMFGTPYPIQGEINLGVLKQDQVNIIVHGHEPLLSRDDRGGQPRARDEWSTPRARAPRASCWPACAARPTRSWCATACRSRATTCSRSWPS